MSDNTTHSIQSILDNLHTAVMVIDENLRIECMNPSAEMLLHYSSNRATHRVVSDIIINEQALFDRLQRSLISRHPFRAYEAQLRIHNNQLIDVSYAVSPIEYAPTGKYLLLEFTQLKYLQKHLQEETLLSQHDASKALIRGLAHEIKNPLGGLRGAAQLLERELDDKNKMFTQIITKEADRLKNLVDRMVGPKDIPKMTTLNVHKVLEHVRQLVCAELKESGDALESIRIVSDYDPSIPDIQADESMLIQSVLNITRNAVVAIRSVANETVTNIKASNKNANNALRANKGQITFKTRTQRNCTIGNIIHPLVARIDISDNGNGVADDIQEKIFLPMITGHAKGTGLGLSIAQSLIQQHQGLIEFTSEPGCTTFTLLLPISLPAERLPTERLASEPGNGEFS